MQHVWCDVPMNTEPHTRSLEAIAARLRATREAFALGQNEFARRAGIASNTYNQYEQAKNLPRLDLANQICDTFGVTLDWIYRGDPSGLPVRTFKLLQEAEVSALVGAKNPKTQGRSKTGTHAV
jgi:DNA-binding XRE family transcriptional regulator